MKLLALLATLVVSFTLTTVKAQNCTTTCYQAGSTTVCNTNCWDY